MIAEFKGPLPKFDQRKWYTVSGRVVYRRSAEGWNAIILADKLAPTAAP